ncbi:hypothetical protein H072_3952 [Dactylellina haptotyla CBS 200.50]|uniref:SMP-30/Gluconolactonase/LRE-like region domain-containing protein n=1 Tax=Dactylellina haptotyla (strain CBS 200.50) TaxID=1284197 RepID=S8BRK0_DACHA|nr:hypothetical protein H072_3952 [Dactylellina haptotyla CBS 200.50]
MKLGAQVAILALAALSGIEAIALPGGSPNNPSPAIAPGPEPHHPWHPSLAARAASAKGSQASGKAIKQKSNRGGRMRSAKSKSFDPKAAKNVEAKKKQVFHFVGDQEDQNANRRVAKADLAFKGPAVDLMDAEVVDSLACTPESMEITFKTDEAFKVVEDTWPKNGEDFFLVSYKGCGAGETDADGDEKFVTKVLDLILDKTKRLAIAQYKDIKMGEAIEGGTVSWGEVAVSPGGQLQVFDTTTGSAANPTQSAKPKPPHKSPLPPYMGLGFKKFLPGAQVNIKTKKVEEGSGSGNSSISAVRRLMRRQDDGTVPAAPVRPVVSTETITINDDGFGVGVGILRDLDTDTNSPDQRQCPFISAAQVDETAMDGTQFFDLTVEKNQKEAEDDLLRSIADNEPTQRGRKARPIRRYMVARAELQRRWTLWGVIKTACNYVIEVPAKWAGDIFDDALKAVQGAWSEAADSLEATGRRIINGKNTFNAVNTNIVFDYPNDATLSAYNLPPITDPAILQKFGGSKGFLISKSDTDALKGEVYCIDCGINGNLRFDGQVTFSVANGIESASLDIDGKMDIGLQLGLEAEGFFQYKKSIDIFQVRLGSGISIPGVIDFAPTLSTAAWFDLTLKGTAQMNAGIHMSWAAPKAKLDLKNAAATQSGWEPEIRRVFNGNVRMDAWVGVDFPIRFGLTMDLFNGKWHHDISLVEKPQLKLWTGIDATIPVGDQLVAQITSGDDKCPGIPLLLQLENALYFDGLPTDVGGNGQLAIWNVPKQPLIQGCYGGGTLESEVDGKTLIEGSPISQPEADQWAQTKPKQEVGMVVTKRKREIDVARRSPQSSTTTNPDGEVDTSPSKPNGTPDNVEIENPAIAPADQGTFVSNVIMSPLDRSFLATSSSGLVYLDSQVSGRSCGKPARWLWDPASGAVVGDAGGNNRLLHAYYTELEKFGVSRLRVHEATKIPVDAEVIFLKASPEGDLFGIIPGDETFSPYFLIACQISDQPTKLFVSQLQRTADLKAIDWQDTIQNVLKDESNQATLTGGKVLGCSLKSLRITGDDEVNADFVPVSSDLVQTLADGNDHVIVPDSHGVVWPTDFKLDGVKFATQLDANGNPLPDPTEPVITADGQVVAPPDSQTEAPVEQISQ